MTSPEVEPLVWVDGALRERSAPALPVDDGAYRDGRGCYTTAAVRGGAVRFAERHVARLCRDAQRLGIGPVEPETARRALRELASAVFSAADGIVRLQASRAPDGPLRLVGVPRALAAAAPEGWRAQTAAHPHPGPAPWGGAKVTSRLALALALDAARGAGLDEAVCFDAAGYLVEGCRSNLFLVERDGRLVTPPLARGGVAGLARALVLERLPGVQERDRAREDVLESAGLIATNAVRGAVVVAELDGRPLGSPEARDWCRRLQEALARD